MNESQFGLSDPDFVGYEIDKYGLFVDNFSVHMYSLGNTWVSFDLLLNVYGDEEAQPVPEPATILLIGTGLVGFAIPRIRRKLKK